MTAALTREQALALLAWQAEMGADEAIAPEAVDRFAESAALAQARENTPEPAPRASAPSSSSSSSSSSPERIPPRRPAPDARPPAPEPAAAETSRESATACRTLDELKQALEAVEGFTLKNTATNLVFEDGNRAAKLMFVGEAPGRDEDIQGVPFVGRSGQLLDRMMAAIGLDRTHAYVANIIPWRPPGNRTPTAAETALCRPFIERQIELVAPEILVFLGGVAAKEMLETTEGIMRLRGRWRTYPKDGGRIRALATLHPAYLLRQPAQKKLAWRDFQMIAHALDGGGGEAE